MLVEGLVFLAPLLARSELLLLVLLSGLELGDELLVLDVELLLGALVAVGIEELLLKLGKLLVDLLV